MKYRKVLITKSTSGEGGEPLFAGWVVRLPSEVAALIVGTQHGNYADPDTVENRDGRAGSINLEDGEVEGDDADSDDADDDDQ